MCGELDDVCTHWVFFLFSVDIWKYLTEHKLALGFFARAAGGALSLSIATAAFHWWSVSGVGFLPSFHKLLVQNHQNLQVLRGDKSERDLFRSNTWLKTPLKYSFCYWNIIKIRKCFQQCVSSELNNLVT